MRHGLTTGGAARPRAARGPLRPGSAAVLLLVVAFLGLFLAGPLLHVFRKACFDQRGFTLLYLRTLFTDPVQLEAIRTGFVIASLVTLGCVCVSLPLAWLFANRSFAGKAALSGLLLVPMILPPFVGAVGMKIVFARAGALSSLCMKLGLTSGFVDWLGAYPLLGIVLMEVLHLFPIMFLNLAAAFANVDPSLEEAAANLGASPMRVFRRVTLPLAGPGLFAGMTLVFVWSFTELGTPLVFGVRRVLPVMIYDAVSEVGTNPMGFAQVVFVLVVCAAGFRLSKWLSAGGGDVASLGRQSVAARETRLGFAGRCAAYPLVGILLAVALLPHLSVILLACSRRWFLSVLPEGYTMEFFRRAVGSEMTQTALINSLGLSLSASAADLVLGLGIAWLCVRRRVIGAQWLDAVAMLPLAVPGVVVAFGYMSFFAGSALDPRRNPMILLAAGYAVRRIPYMLRAAHAGLQQVSRVYEDAAANLGARPLRVVRRVTVPLISANLLAGGILCLAFSMLEVSESLVLAQTESYYPITKAIYVLMEGLENGVNVAAAMGVWAMALLAAALLWTSALLGRRMGQLFRVG